MKKLNKDEFENLAYGPDALLLDTPEINDIKVKIIKDRNYDVQEPFTKTVNQEVIINLILDFESDESGHNNPERENAFVWFLMKTENMIKDFKHFMVSLLELNDKALRWLWLYDEYKVYKTGKSLIPIITYNHVMSIVREYITHNKLVPIDIVRLMMCIIQGKHWGMRSMKKTIDSIAVIYYDCMRMCKDNIRLMDNIYPALYDVSPSSLLRLYADDKGVSLIDYWNAGGSWVPRHMDVTLVYQYLEAKLEHSREVEIHGNIYDIMIRWIGCNESVYYEQVLLEECKKLVIDLVKFNANNVTFISWKLSEEDYDRVNEMLLMADGNAIPLKSIMQYDRFKLFQTQKEPTQQEVIKLIQQNIGDIPFNIINPVVLGVAIGIYDKENLLKLFKHNPNIVNTNIDVVTYICDHIHTYSKMTTSKLTDVLFSEEIFSKLSDDNMDKLLAGKDIHLIYSRYPWTIKYVPDTMVTPFDVKLTVFNNPEILKYVSTSKIPTDVAKSAIAKMPYIKFNYEDNTDIITLVTAIHLATIISNGVGYGYIFDCFLTVYRNSFIQILLFDLDTE